MPNLRLISLGLLLLVFSASGSTCVRQELLPVTLPPTAPMDQLIGAVNANTAKISSVSVNQATLTVPGAPTLPVNIALMPPRRFRMRATTAITGPEVDLGSNDDLFWMWIRRSQPPAMYFCRHDQYAASAAKQIMPVEPQWIVEAMGLVQFSPADLPQGPTPVGQGRVQIRTVRRSATGDLTKVTVLDASRGLVLEQHLYDPQGNRIATAITNQHRRDPVTGAILPRHIEIQYPGAQLSLRIDIANLQVNVLPAESPQLWAKPEYTGYPNVNLADMNNLVHSSGGGNPAPPGAIAPVATPAAAIYRRGP